MDFINLFLYTFNGVVFIQINFIQHEAVDQCDVFTSKGMSIST